MKRRPRLSVTTLLAELKRRRIYPVIAAYAVVAWIVLQVGEVTLEPLGFSSRAMTFLIFAVVVGFALVLVLSWLFDLTPGGFVRDDGPVNQPVPADGQPSIAVLPFVDMSAERDQAYFCEGVAEEILNALTKLPDLKVAARSASFRYREIAGDVKKIGRDLGVAAIVEGSVRKSAERIRVSAQLVNVADGYQLWAQTFDEVPKDIFAIQDEIATGIADSLLDELTPKDRRALKTTSSSDFSAYDYYLRGRKFFKRFNKSDMEFARQMFRQAIRIDPAFAPAWAGYADCHSFLIMYADPKPDYLAEANQASCKALELDPHLAEAHASRGLAFLVSEEFQQAEGEFEKAIDLNPKLFEAYYYYARTRFHQGELESAAELFRKAADVDPSDYQSRCLRIQILRGQGRIRQARLEAKDAIAVVEKHLAWNPDDTRALHLGAGSLIVLGDAERAKRWLGRALEIDPNDSVLLYNVACNYAVIGEPDKALDYLNAAVDHGMVSISWIRNDTDIDPLRSHPGYAELLARIEAKDIAASGSAG